MDAAVKKANWKLIGEAESFAAGCSRGRMELRLVDALKASMAEVSGLEAVIAEAKKTAVGYILKVNDSPSQIVERLNRTPETARRAGSGAGSSASTFGASGQPT